MTNSTLLPPIPANIVDTTAPQIIGTLFNWALYGVLSVQTYVYYLNFPDDNLWNKTLVYGTYIFEVVQTAMTAADLYFWFASGFGNMNHLGNVNISPADTPILCGVLAAVVQLFFAYRIYTLRKSYLWICVLIVLTAIIQTAGALAVGYRAFKLQEYSRFHENVLFPQAFDVWLIGDTVCDILIAGTMLRLFYATRKQATSHGTQILGKLVRLIIETNILTASVALVSFVSYVALPDGNVFICMTLIMGKLYSNTLLVTFNNRISLRNMGTKTTTHESGGSGHMPPIRQPSSFSNQVNTFRLATDSFQDGVIGDAESYEIKPLPPSKTRILASNISAV